MNDPYSVLGVSRTASEDEIKQAYRRLAKEYHPDKPGGNETKFKQINEAYDYIKNPPEEEPEPSPWDGFEDMFAQQFGGRNPFDRQFHQPHAQNQDIRVTVYVTLEELFSSASKNIDVKYGNNSKQVTLRIPRGVTDGTEVQYTGYGVDVYPGRPGNLFVTYRVKKHESYTLEEYDLVKRLNIGIREAMIGTEIVITTLDGRNLKLNIKPGTQPRTRLRIPEGGLPKRNQPNGNLYVELHIRIPKLDQNDLEKPLKDLI